MINIVVPMAGHSIFFDDQRYVFPKPLLEIDGQPMIQRVMDSLNEISLPKRFIFVINRNDATRYHLDRVLRLLSDSNAIVIYQEGDAKGAVCSILLGVEHIDNDAPLLISNSDQILVNALNPALLYFAKEQADAGTICFDSVHPQWSYVQVDASGAIIETAEKRPISRHAIAGVYYFKHGRYFVEAAMRSIEKDVNVNGKYFTSLTFNQLILDGRRLRMYKISNDQYHSFYSPEKIEHYQRILSIDGESNRNTRQGVSV